MAFLGGPVVKNPPSNAGDTGSIPGLGTKTPHAMGQLSPSATTSASELKSLGAVGTEVLAPQSLRPATGESPHSNQDPEQSKK